MTKHPLQSKEWEKARKQMGIEVLRLEDYLLTLHKIPFTNYKIGYLPRSIMPSKKVLNELYDYGKKNKVIFIKIEPYVEKSKLQITNVKSNSNFKIQISKHPLFPAWTQILDLTKSEEELLKNMHHKTRYNIRLAEKKGVIVKEESTDQGFEIFAKLYFETTKRQKYFGHDYRYHKIVLDNLKNRISHILIAYYNNIPLAAYELFYLDGIIYYVYGGTSDQYRNLMASNLLMWEAIKLGKKLGAKKFDMWGSLPPDYDPTHPWSGFTRFKEGYGTKFVEMVGSYDLVINPLLYKIYNSIYSLREIFLKLKSSL
ncbi:MAG: peptidoglycan bridge formation glycyltransferase FemA/FemB family protein [Candidatus Roizmanbacteria bacterium]